jgi:hypothetical protein
MTFEKLKYLLEIICGWFPQLHDIFCITTFAEIK